MHNAHAEVGLEQRLDTKPSREQVIDIVGEGGGERGGATDMVEPSTTPRHDHDEVIY